MADIRHSIPITAKVETIFPLVSTGAGFGQWWAEDVSEAGGAVELGFFKRATVYRVRLKMNSAPKQAEWVCESGDEWNGTRLSFQLEPSKDGTLVRFAHAGWRTETDYFIACNTTWGELMYRLKNVAEGKSRGPLFLTSALAY
jgi:uncharacterized protein YndB with AHSA1/START domain